jgi:hypothetical protein
MVKCWGCSYRICPKRTISSDINKPLILILDLRFLRLAFIAFAFLRAKVATAMFAETPDNSKYSRQLIPISRSFTIIMTRDSDITINAQHSCGTLQDLRTTTNRKCPSTVTGSVTVGAVVL